ncbi:hypothetical protein [Streptomyces luteireticuli]|uniref:Uncharacterized protein n=1 Tax=Streptomyces luteireticuli TaxID=173858 RepID=A0ABP3INC3_9ACTN
MTATPADRPRPVIRQTPGTDAIANGATAPRTRTGRPTRRNTNKGKGGRTGQHYRAKPDLPSYDRPPASDVTITRPDGTTQTIPARKPIPTPTPRRGRRRKRTGPLICAWCGRPITGTPARSTEPRTKGKPIHPVHHQRHTRPPTPAKRTA